MYKKLYIINVYNLVYLEIIHICESITKIYAINIPIISKSFLLPSYFLLLLLSVLLFCDDLTEELLFSQFLGIQYSIMCAIPLNINKSLGFTYLPSCMTETFYSLANTTLFPPIPQPLASTILLSASEFDYFRFHISVVLYRICPVSGLFHSLFRLVYCLQVHLGC